MADDPCKSTVLDRVKDAVSDANHPIWRILNVAVIGLFVLVFSAINASNFDETELLMWLEIIGALAGYEIIKSKAVKK